MTLSEFERLLDAYGPHPTDWSEQQRQDVVRLLGTSEPAKRALKQALALDRALSQMAPLVSDERLEALVNRVVRAAPPREAPSLVPDYTKRLFVPPRSFGKGFAGAFAASCFLIGVAIGSSVEMTGVTTQATATTTTTASSVDLAGLPLGSTTRIKIGIE
jgi:hypothetical protein